MSDKSKPARFAAGRGERRGAARGTARAGGTNGVDTDKLGREQQRRATAYGRARGQL